MLLPRRTDEVEGKINLLSAIAAAVATFRTQYDSRFWGKNIFVLSTIPVFGKKHIRTRYDFCQS